MTTLSRITLLLLLSVLTAGCATRGALQTDYNPCQRVELELAPLWTASAAWTPTEDGLMLIGPGSHSLLVYNLRGELERQVELDPLATLEYASPVRLQATDDGYFIGDKTQILWLGRDFEKRRLWKPLDHLGKAGVSGGSISDFTVVGDTVYAYADFLWESEDAEEEAAPNWFRGFVRIDLDEPEYVSLHEFAIEDEELQDYYYYSKRPYVADLDRNAYVLRYSDPPQILRGSRRQLRPLFEATGFEHLNITSLYAWDGRLYLLGWQKVEPPAEEQAQEPTMPELREGAPSAAQLMAIKKSFEEGEVRRFLVEVDPKTGRRLRQYRLPAQAESVKLLPGHSYWALIGESSVPNLNDEAKSAHFTLLPASWFHSRRTDVDEIALHCPADPVPGDSAPADSVGPSGPG